MYMSCHELQPSGEVTVCIFSHQLQLGLLYKQSPTLRQCYANEIRLVLGNNPGIEVRVVFCVTAHFVEVVMV